jgi:ArsR family transcriptional regulator, zinc-responsive transcriptional repressor
MVDSATPAREALDERQLANAVELLRSLGAPHRLAIVLELTHGPRCVHELVDLLGISQSLASQHLRVLRTTGLVSGARQGKETLYTLTDEHVARIAMDALTHGSEPGHRTHPVHEPTTEEHQP